MTNKESKEIEELLADVDEPIEDVKLDLELVKKNLPDYSNEKLCEMIVCDRYFGFNQTIAIMCMEELAKRRINGDTFAFEKYIDDSYNSLPVLPNFEQFDIRKVLQQAINQNRGKK